MTCFVQFRGFWIAAVAALALPVIACAQTIAEGSTGNLDLASGEGRILSFTAPVDSVLVADPGIADLQVVSPGLIYVFGKAPGRPA